MHPTDSRRLALAAYPMHHELTTRVSDLDGYGHLNAIRIGHLYEDARAAFYVDIEREARARTLVAQLTIRYLGEGFWPGAVQIGTGILRIGNRSFEMAQGLFQKGRCIGLCDTVIVNTANGASAPLPAAYREQIAGKMLRALENAS